MTTNHIITLPQHGSPEIGYLSLFEENNQIPFGIKRIYYTYDVPVGVKRGMHAHKKLQQVIWCPYGSIEIILDDGTTKTSYLLDSPNKALVMIKGYWRDIYWKKEGSVLCIAASDLYTEDDYIRDYDEFIKYAREECWKDED
jgi:dTDP-4-dehydrorhamnose 3,5-epimerase-like enzyme